MLDMETVNAASRELLMLSTRSITAQQLVERAYAFVHKPIAVLDELYQVIAFYAPGVDRADCERKDDDNIVKRREWHRTVQEAEEPLIDDNEGGKYRAMCMDIKFNGIAVGKLALMETQPFQPEDAEIVKALCSALAIKLVGNSSPVLTSLERERSALLTALIAGESLREDLETLLVFLGVPEDHRMRVLVFRTVGEHAIDYLHIRRRLDSLFDVICCEIDGDFVCVTGDREYRESVKALEQLAEESDMVCGVCRAFDDFGAIRDYYKQAQSAGKIASRRCVRLLDYSACVADDIIALCQMERRGMTFCRPEILALSAYDRNNGTDYLDTLTIYLNNLCNMAQTARESHLHYNTIKYRLKLIEEICGIHAVSADDLCECLLSIRIIRQYPQHKSMQGLMHTSGKTEHQGASSRKKSSESL